MNKTKLQKLKQGASFVLLLFPSLLFSQADCSFYFGKPIPEKAEKIGTFPLTFQGIFSGPDSTTELLIYNNTVITRFFILYTTTRKKISDSKDIYLKDGEIFGLSSQSFPYQEDNDTIYFFYPNETELFSAENGEIRMFDNKCYLNIMEDNSFYTALLLDFSTPDSLSMKNFDYDKVWDKLVAAKCLISVDQDKDVYCIGILKQKTFLNVLDGFSEGTSYTRIKEE